MNKRNIIIIGISLVVLLGGFVGYRTVHKQNVLSSLEEMKIETRNRLEVAKEYSYEEVLNGISLEEMEDLNIKLLYKDKGFQTLTFETIGPVTLNITLQHPYGTVSREVVIEVVDLIAPTITGEDRIEVNEGETLSFEELYEVKDNYDKEVKLVVDEQELDISVPGEYIVKLSATDSSNNTTTKEIVVEVLEVEEEIVEEVVYVQESTTHYDTPTTVTTLSGSLNDQIDAVIANIISDGMSDSEKASAVYYWMQSNLQYRAGAANSNSVTTNAEILMDTYRGQCQHWAALSAAFMDRLGISYTYIDGLASNYGTEYNYHAWIKVNGLHFDPLMGVLYGSTQFNQVSSDFILNTKGSHDWDKSVYGN